MSQINPKICLIEGATALGEVVEPHGFAFRLTESGAGSGGSFAAGVFERGDRSIEFSFRYGLGMVSYRLGSVVLDHETFMRFSGNWPQRRYPGLGVDPMDSFRALAQDLQSFFGDFVAGSGEEFLAVAKDAAANPNRYKGFAALGKK